MVLLLNYINNSGFYKVATKRANRNNIPIQLLTLVNSG